jgi:hypothetical protein
VLAARCLADAAGPGRGDGLPAAPDKPWPTFVEGGATYVNLYLRPELPEDGDARLGHEFLEVILPDARERTRFKQWLSHKLHRPEVPGPSIVMVAQDTFGVGRGTLFKILTALFGREYIARPEFGDVIGIGGQAAYNEWMATAILAFVNETSAEEDHRYTIRQRAYERINELVDTHARCAGSRVSMKSSTRPNAGQGSSSRRTTARHSPSPTSAAA